MTRDWKDPAMRRSSTFIRSTTVQAALGTACAVAAVLPLPSRADLSIGNNPLYLTAGKANVLVTLDNSNSMDEAPNGEAVGSASAQSKSEIARSVIRGLTDTYRSRVNMGLMGYRQNSPSDNVIHTSPYDVSYDPAHYDPAWTGARSSPTHKKYRIPNPQDAGNYIYYNVALPFYSGGSQGTAYCYSKDADASNNFVEAGDTVNGPWDSYTCYGKKTGTSNAIPGVGGTTAASVGYAGSVVYNGQLSPTDSDFAQGILDFGKQLTWAAVARTWLRNDSPGRGFLQVPLADLNSTQATAIKDKLACNVPDNPAGCTTTGMKNAGLTPIEGTLLTARDYYNGGWNNTGEGYSSGCYPLPVSCGKNFVILLTDGLPSTSRNGTALSNPATAIDEAAAAAAALKADGVLTYVIGFALPYGTDPATLDRLAVAGGTAVHYDASDTSSLEAAFRTIFDDIFRRSSSFGSLSQNSAAINSGSRIYQARFDSTDWSGELVSLQPDAAGALSQVWSTADAGRIAAWGSRKVFTLKPGTGGVAFKTLADLSAAQQTALKTTNCSATLTGDACAQARIDWARGDRSKEESSGPLRRRSGVVGDIISSSPYLLKANNTLFAGANDGMLHAFDASTGNERFAYVPNAVFSKLYKLSNPNYSHEYLVDGEITVSTTAETPGRNILVGSLGRGGKALYALDVTTPGSFSAANVLWEFTDSDLGLVLGKPFIAKLNNGRAAVVVGNGVNSAAERSVLFIIDAITGELIKKIDTAAGSALASNGLSSPTGWDADGNGTLDTLYAGDLLGNLWKFDLSAGSAGTWGITPNLAGIGLPMFVATNAGGIRQPITGGVGVGIDAKKGDPNFGKRWVFFGTGRYVTSSDVTDTTVQSWYGLIDENAVITGRTALKQRSIDLATTSAGQSVRAFSVATAGDMAGKKGWYLDFTTPAGGATGERIVGESKFFGSVLLASSIIPSSNVCVAGGSGFVNAIDPFSGAAIATPFFDVNADGSFNSTDTIGSTLPGGARSVGSIDLQNNLTGDCSLMGGQAYCGGTAGGRPGKTPYKDPQRIGRIAWREIIRP
jgi:type IV pilus assembly protein PilY1